MQIEKDLAQAVAEDSPEMSEHTDDKTLRWLLDLDRTEPQDNLFKVDLDDYVEEGLSDYEAEVASRPMFRGKAGADDLSTYVGEEIVITSQGEGSDIYSNSRHEVDVEEPSDSEYGDEAMAVDYSAKQRHASADSAVSVEDGLDILGQIDEDSEHKAASEAVLASQSSPGQEASSAVIPETNGADIQPLEAADFVATCPPQADDEAFDQYLLQGGAIEPVNPDPEELTVEPAEGVQSVDPALGLAIDYHDDFLAIPGFDDEPGAGDIDELFVDFDVVLPEGETGEPMSQQLEEVAQETDVKADEEEGFQVFGDDLFAGELLEDSLDVSAQAPEDIDAFFEDIGDVVFDDDVGGGNDLLGVVAQSTGDGDSSGAESPRSWAPSEGASAEETSPRSWAPTVETSPTEWAPTEEEAPSDRSWCVPEGISFNYTSRSGTEIFTDFLDAFLEEGSVELEKLEDAVGAWEADVSSDAAYATVTRTLHTIKGIAKGVGLQFYGTLIHNFETLLEALPSPVQGEEEQYFRLVNAWLDAAVGGLEQVRNTREDLTSEFPVQAGAPVHSEVSAQQPDSAKMEPEAQPVAPSLDLSSVEKAERKQRDRKIADEGARALAAQQSVRITPERLDRLLNLSNQAQQLGVRTAQSTVRGKRASGELQSRLQSVRSHISSITDQALFNVRAGGRPAGAGMDALEMDQYSELQEAANIIREGIEDLVDLIEISNRHNSQVEVLLKQQSAVIASLGSSIRAARVVPVSRLMPGLRRLVRTVSNDLGKNAALGVINEVGTLDRDDYARCQIILEHMVRNALDHGIEMPADRHEAGKPMAGQISIDVRQVGANSLITLADDGRGISPDSMREAARRKELDVDTDALTDDEALRLIFHKGFSTARSVSEISGRGVGMDIVISELQQMGGDIRIESTQGEGTAFHISIPTNVTVNGALLVNAGESSYAIPLGGLIAVEQVPAEAFFESIETGDALELSGIRCEPAYLATLCQQDARPDKKTWGATVPMIVAGSGARHMAIAIDHVEEALELVIRSLGPQFAAVPGVAGAATTADGEAVVALDLNLLVDSLPEKEQQSLFMEPDSDEPLRVLVVDDSRTQRMVTTNQLENLGVETMTAEHGGVAIELLNSAEQLPDIVLLDVEMPVKDGIQTLRDIRKSSRYSHLPVIMVTSRTGLKHRTLAEQAGCNGYMGKPFNFPMLVGQINELTGHRLELV